MKESIIYVLFGSQRSIENYLISLNHLINKTAHLDFIVYSYGQALIENSEHFLYQLNQYSKFILISKKDFDLIHHAQCAEARSFMKNHNL
jgi:hypothetical protein